MCRALSAIRALHGAAGDLQVGGHLVDGEPQPVPQHEDPALPGTQRGERLHEFVALAGVEGRRRGHLRQFGRGLLPPPGSAVGVDARVDQDPPHISVFGLAAPDPWPGDVQLGQGSLHQVLRCMPVAAQQVGGSHSCDLRIRTYSEKS